jgi:hypothetical protein
MNDAASLLDSPDIVLLPFPKHPPDDSHRIRSAYVEHFSAYRWDHFVTLTFASAVSKRAAETIVDERFRRRLEQLGQQRVDYVGAIEFGPVGGRLHVHLLLSGTARLSVEAVRDAWTSGLAEVRPYDASVGPGYVLKTFGEDDPNMLLRDARQVLA